MNWSAQPGHIWLKTPLWCISQRRRVTEAQDSLWMAAALRGGVVVRIEHYTAPGVRELGRPRKLMPHARALVRTA